MDAICVAKNNMDFTNVSNRWKQDFSKRPTWFDAGLALQQILWGNAVGFRAPLYSRVLIQSALFRAGCFVQRYAWFIIVSLLTLFTFCSIGLRKVHIETDIVKLWVSEGGRLDDELHFLEDLQKQYWTNHRPDKAYEALHFFPDDPDPRLSQIPEDEAPTLAYQVLIQTADPNTPGQNVLTRRELLRHVDLVEITRIRVNKFGFDWAFSDLCFKPGQLDIENDSLAYSLKLTLERLIPCIWISPIDCFFEGAKPLGPSPPIQTDSIPFGPMLHLLIPDIPAQASWMNIDPSRILQQVTNGFSLGTIQNFFTRSGIGHGYLRRPCIDPLDPKCPKSAPNYFSSACEALKAMESAPQHFQSLEFCSGQLQQFCAALFSTIVLWHFVGLLGSLLICMGLMSQTIKRLVLSILLLSTLPTSTTAQKNDTNITHFMPTDYLFRILDRIDKNDNKFVGIDNKFAEIQKDIFGIQKDMVGIQKDIARIETKLDSFVSGHLTLLGLFMTVIGIFVAVVLALASRNGGTRQQPAPPPLAPALVPVIPNLPPQPIAAAPPNANAGHGGAAGVLEEDNNIVDAADQLLNPPPAAGADPPRPVSPAGWLTWLRSLIARRN